MLVDESEALVKDLREAALRPGVVKRWRDLMLRAAAHIETLQAWVDNEGDEG